jgi:hypothetical protein
VKNEEGKEQEKTKEVENGRNKINNKKLHLTSHLEGAGFEF